MIAQIKENPVIGHRGFFLSVEGIDGAGKTTVVKKIGTELTKQGYAVQIVREPGGTLISEQIRSILLDPDNRNLVAPAEALLYVAARAQLVEEVIRSSLSTNKLLICDRYIDSTLAYQGGGRGLDLAWLQTLNQLATGGLEPDLTLLLDLEPLEGYQRRNARFKPNELPKDRLEEESEAFYQRVREAYLALARKEPKRIKVLNASKSQPEVEEKAWSLVREALAWHEGKRTI